MGTILGPILLSLSLSFTGVSVVANQPECSTNTDLMGEYVLKDKEISLCIDNIKGNGETVQNVLKHETIHAIHHNLGWEQRTLLHEDLITFLVRHFIDDGETVFVLLNYEATDQEFEARILTHLPTDWIALALLISSL